MDKETLLAKVKGTYTQAQLIKWVECLESSYGTSKPKPKTNKIGDVYMHPIFNHPYVLLHTTKDHGWVCTLLTSEEECPEIITKCKSRFFNENYITKVLFTVHQPIGRFVAVYDNNSQLKKIYSELKEVFV